MNNSRIYWKDVDIVSTLLTCLGYVYKCRNKLNNKKKYTWLKNILPMFDKTFCGCDKNRHCPQINMIIKRQRIPTFLYT